MESKRHVLSVGVLIIFLALNTATSKSQSSFKDDPPRPDPTVETTATVSLWAAPLR